MKVGLGGIVVLGISRNREVMWSFVEFVMGCMSIF